MQLVLIGVIYIFSYNFHYYLEYTGSQLSPYTEYQMPILYGIGAAINLLTLCGFVFFINDRLNKNLMKVSLFKKLQDVVPSSTLYYINFLLCLAIIGYLTTRGVNLFWASGDLYELYKFNLDSIGGIGVYFGIFFFYMLLYKPYKKSMFLIHLIFFSFLIFAISRGTRMLIVPPLVMYFLYFFENKFKWQWIIGLAGLGMFILTAIDRFKNGIGLFEDNTKGSDLIINNQAEILYGANGVIYLVYNNIVDVFSRLKLLLGLFLTSVLPPGIFHDSWKYPHFTSIYNASAGGGGLSTVGTYAMFSWAGPIILGAYIALIGNHLYSEAKRSIYPRIWFTMTLLMITRWFTYDLNVMFRLPFYTFIVFICYVSLTGKEEKKI